MNDQTTSDKTSNKKKKWTKSMSNKQNSNNMGGFGCFMFLGFIGAAVYFISVSTGFWDGVLGILKAAVWPAFLVFELLQTLMS